MTSFADDFELDSDLLKLMSLEVEMTSSMKRSQPVQSTPASIYVLERHDIELSGYTSLADLLMLIPGVDARRIDNNRWAVSVRSTASRFNSNLMVILDGRNVSEPTVNGIHWEALNYPSQDIERIELVRGAAGSLWGNSANNGILNIITRHSIDTQGADIKLSFGENGTHSAELRYGSTINDEISYRLYAMNNKTSSSHGKNYKGTYVPANDSRNIDTLGLQVDYQYGLKSSAKFQYHRSDGEAGITTRGIDPVDWGLNYNQQINRTTLDSANIKVAHHVNDDFKYFAQLSYTDSFAASKITQEAYKKWMLNTAVNYQWDGGFFSAGLDYEDNSGDLRSDGSIFILESMAYGAFFQNESYFLDDKLKVLIGVRWDVLELYGTEASPNIRFNYAYDQTQSVWGAYSRGNRIMINADDDAPLMFVTPNETLPIPNVSKIKPSNSIEHATSIEIGYRYKTSTLDFNVSLFSTEYDSLFVGNQSCAFVDLQTFSPHGEIDCATLGLLLASGGLGSGQPTPTIVPVQITVIENTGNGHANGVDVVASWQTSARLKTVVGYSKVKQDIDNLQGSQIALSPNKLDAEQMYMRLQYRMNNSVSMQLSSKHVGKNRSLRSASYNLIDFALHWNIHDDLRLTFAGENLANTAFVEFVKEEELFTASSAVGRNFNMFVRYRF